MPDLVTCPECNTEYSSDARLCPKCGRTRPEPRPPGSPDDDDEAPGEADDED